jgi:hypothetical protein
MASKATDTAGKPFELGPLPRAGVGRISWRFRRGIRFEPGDKLVLDTATFTLYRHRLVKPRRRARR